MDTLRRWNWHSSYQCGPRVASFQGRAADRLQAAAMAHWKLGYDTIPDRAGSIGYGKATSGAALGTNSRENQNFLLANRRCASCQDEVSNRIPGPIVGPPKLNQGGHRLSGFCPFLYRSDGSPSGLHRFGSGNRSGRTFDERRPGWRPQKGLGLRIL